LAKETLFVDAATARRDARFDVSLDAAQKNAFAFERRSRSFHGLSQTTVAIWLRRKS
jgi:hypothetical protein